MALAEVSKITLFFPYRDFRCVSEKLHEMECVEIIPVDSSTANNTGTLVRFLDDKNTITRKDFEEASRELDRLGFAIETISKAMEIRSAAGGATPSEKPNGSTISDGMFESATSIAEGADRLLLEERYDYSSVCLQVENLWKNYLESERASANYQKEAARLKPWIDISVELRKISDGSSIKITAGQISSPKWDEFVSSLEKETSTESDGELSCTYKISDDGKEISFGIIYPVALLEKVEALIRRFGVSVISYPNSTYTPKEMYSRYVHLFEAMKKRSWRRILKLAGFSSIHLPRLKLLYEHFLKIKTLASSERLMSGTNTFRFFNGWILNGRVKELEDFLKIKNIPYHIIAVKPSRGDDIPIVLQNKKPIEPFEVVTDLYGKPNYYEPDPTPWLAPFFAVFFGICMADALYGAIIAIAGIVGLLKLKTASSKKFMKLVLYCGISTTIFGAMVGGYFGNLIDRFGIFSFLVPIKNRLMVFDPLKNSIIFLVGCLVLGFVQTLLGSLIKFFTDIKNSNLRDAFLGDLPTIGIQVVFPLLVAAGVFGAKILPMNIILVALGIFSVMLMINQWIISDGIVLKLFQMFFGVYGAITGNALSDVLSYSRLFALGLSTSLLAMVLNELAALGFSIPYIGYILGALVIIIFHPFIIAIGSLGAYVHTSRLQYLEFFNKFFQGGGREMKPLHFEKKYTP